MKYQWIGFMLCFWVSAHTGKVSTVIDKISNFYVQENSKEALTQEAIDHLLSNLDEYSSYLSPLHAKKMKEALSGQFFGIGIALKLHQGKLYVENVLPNSPAKAANLQAGDEITHINDRSIDPNSLEANVTAILGKDKTPVYLTINDTVRKVNRDYVDRLDLTYKDMGNIGYIQLFLFHSKTKALLEETILSHPKSAYLIDLRHNPGGLLSAALDTCALFFDYQPEFPLTKLHTRYGQKDVYLPKRSKAITQKPIFLLIGPYSASGSELFSSVLQFYNRATILGQRSKGKGSVQSLIPLDDGSILKLTTAHFTTPDGSKIDQHGIEPHLQFKKDPLEASFRYIQKNLQPGENQ